MKLKELGKTGVFLPEIGLGTANYHGGPGPLRRGLEAGARFIDTAESYGTESVIREAMAGLRDQVFLATKVSPENFRAPDLRTSVEASLQRLGVEVIDLLQLHQPNPSIPIEETMEAMARLVTEGKVRFAGVSNFSAAQLEAAQRAFGKHPIVSNQVRYNIVDRTIESGLLEYCRSHHITVLAYSPLARGLSRVLDCDPGGALQKLAARLGKTPAQIVLNWCLCKEGVVAIPKGSSTGHILENCGASDWRLDPKDLAMLDSAILSRSRNRFDRFVRQYTPRLLSPILVRGLDLLPRSIRRRFT